MWYTHMHICKRSYKYAHCCQRFLPWLAPAVRTQINSHLNVASHPENDPLTTALLLHFISAICAH